jgi:hypothetical protein
MVYASHDTLDRLPEGYVQHSREVVGNPAKKIRDFQRK